MDTLVSFNFSGFINFCAEDKETIEMVKSSKNGIEAVEKVVNKMHDLARSYVLIRRGSVQFSQGVECTLIANEIVKKI